MIPINAISTDNRVNNAILRKIVKENTGIYTKTLHMNPKFKYVEQFIPSSATGLDISYRSTEYKGATYKVKYLSGCFNPFIIRIK